MKKLLIILVVLLLLGGGGAAAWWFYLRADPNAPPPPPEPPEFFSVPLPPGDKEVLVINIVKNGKAEKHFFMRFTLMFDAAEKRDKAKALMPALINDFNEELHGLLARKLVEESKYDLDLIQAQLQKVCDRRLGPGTVLKVSIDNMEQQP
jgi:flagellar protein FliL